ncbi:hypothetical protein SPOG_05725 [Schizosaccharomyces cryophilus OY26]|uniref:Uncharacterized protein n=1 Tax=Schizosaccharomyces cryophilus (strain OY26 / ATCC MYA-4695 / CBS 11777 / NBRC 106824 / NRRL Y48691) TaxID=653667 RepID=S9W1M6_SCHCR|nr:uncharacterized protein SPOG_05725 [Schizosaccharomyces cryophilus OY26]EPY53913.1 hypothetical protein SPOG_05725 [Schizosaccharomyces cryophilus OY26]
MSEKELKLDSSDPPAYNHANVYSADLEKGLCLDTPKDIKNPSNSTSVKAKHSKKTPRNGSQNSIALIKKSYEEVLKQLSLRFSDNLVIIDESQRLPSTLFFSLMCTLAISYCFKLLSWLEQVYSDDKLSWALLAPLGPLLVIWTSLFGLFYYSSSFAVKVARTIAQVILGVAVVVAVFIGGVAVVVAVLIGGVAVVVAVLIGGIGAAGVFVVGLLCWGFYNITVFGLGMEFKRSAENTGSPTLPRYQQRDDTLAPPPTTTNEEIELQSNPTTQS